MNTTKPAIKSFWKSKTVTSVLLSFGLSLIPTVTAISEEGFKSYLVVALVGTILATWKALEGRADATAIVVSPSFLPGPSTRSEAVAVAQQLVQQLSQER